MTSLPLTLYAFYIGIDLRNEETSDALTAILRRHTPSWSVFTGFGSFQGEEEPMCQVQMSLPDRITAEAIASEVRAHFNQYGVGIVALGTFERVTW